MTQNQATLIGLTAILLWSSVVGLIRTVSDHFGALGGAALMYSVATVFLCLSLGRPRIAPLPRAYLYWGSVLFVSYELCLSLSIGFADHARQAIEVGMVNYLWPSFTLLATVLFHHRPARWRLLLPGFVLSMLGIAWVLGGEQGLDGAMMWANIRSNPLSYGLAFAGALIWAAYCVLTARLAQGQNAITLFFLLVALVLWMKYLAFGSGSLHWHAASILYLLLAAAAMGFGYAAWNVGILHGRVTLLAGASYFIPVLSALLSALVLSTALPWAF